MVVVVVVAVVVVMSVVTSAMFRLRLSLEFQRAKRGHWKVDATTLAGQSVMQGPQYLSLKRLLIIAFGV